MSIVFTPNGNLDVATDSVDLPEQAGQNQVISGAMLRCTNLRLDKSGLARTRYGSMTVNQTAIGAVNQLVTQGENRYDFCSGAIYKNEISIDSGLASGNWNAVLYNPYNIETQAVYCLNGTDRLKVEDETVYQWGIEPPILAPVCQKGSDYACSIASDQTGLTDSNWLYTTMGPGEYYCTYDWEVQELYQGDSLFSETNPYCSTYYFENVTQYATYGVYEVVYTYARYDGDTLICESNASPIATTLIESQLTVEWEASTDPQVTHVRLYRSLLDVSGQYFFMVAVPIGTTYATVTMKDEELGAQADTTHERPPEGGTDVIGPSFGGQLFIIKDNFLYFSLPMQPEYWPPSYYIEVTAPQFPIMAGTFFGGNLMLASEHEIFLVSGSGAGSYFPQPMSATTGTKAKKCFLAVKGYGIFHLGSDGIYLYTSAKDTSLTDSRFKPIFEGYDAGSIPGLRRDRIYNCIMAFWQNRFWFGYPRKYQNYCKDFMVMDLESGKAVHYQYPFAVMCLSPDYENSRLLAGASDGYVYHIDNAQMTRDTSTEIDWDIQSKEFLEFPKYFPRYARWDVTLKNQATATGEVMLEGTVKQSHPLTTSRQTRKRLIKTCTGKRLSVRVHGSGPAEIYGVEVE